MNNKECIEQRINDLKEVLEEIDRLDSVKEKLIKTNNLKDLTEDVFADQEDVYSVISDYVEKEIDLQRLIIKGLNEKIERVCDVIDPENTKKVENNKVPENNIEENLEESVEENLEGESADNESTKSEDEIITDEIQEEDSVEKVADEVISDEMIEDMANKLMEDVKEEEK